MGAHFSTDGATSRAISIWCQQSNAHTYPYIYIQKTSFSSGAWENHRAPKLLPIGSHPIGDGSNERPAGAFRSKQHNFKSIRLIGKSSVVYPTTSVWDRRNQANKLCSPIYLFDIRHLGQLSSPLWMSVKQRKWTTLILRLSWGLVIYGKLIAS